MCLNIYLTGFGSFPHTQQARSAEASIVKPLKVSQIACDVQDLVGHELMAVRQPEHSLPGTVAHDVQYILTENQHDPQ